MINFVMNFAPWKVFAFQAVDSNIKQRLMSKLDSTSDQRFRYFKINGDPRTKTNEAGDLVWNETKRAKLREIAPRVNDAWNQARDDAARRSTSLTKAVVLGAVWDTVVVCGLTLWRNKCVLGLGYAGMAIVVLTPLIKLTLDTLAPHLLPAVYRKIEEQVSSALLSVVMMAYQAALIYDGRFEIGLGEVIFGLLPAIQQMQGDNSNPMMKAAPYTQINGFTPEHADEIVEDLGSLVQLHLDVQKRFPSITIDNNIRANVDRWSAAIEAVINQYPEAQRPEDVERLNRLLQAAQRDPSANNWQNLKVWASNLHHRYAHLNEPVNRVAWNVVDSTLGRSRDEYRQLAIHQIATQAARNGSPLQGEALMQMATESVDTDAKVQELNDELEQLQWIQRLSSNLEKMRWEDFCNPKFQERQNSLAYLRRLHAELNRRRGAHPERNTPTYQQLQALASSVEALLNQAERANNQLRRAKKDERKATRQALLRSETAQQALEGLKAAAKLQIPAIAKARIEKELSLRYTDLAHGSPQLEWEHFYAKAHEHRGVFADFRKSHAAIRRNLEMQTQENREKPAGQQLIRLERAMRAVIQQVEAANQQLYPERNGRGVALKKEARDHALQQIASSEKARKAMTELREAAVAYRQANQTYLNCDIDNSAQGTFNNLAKEIHKEIHYFDAKQLETGYQALRSRCSKSYNPAVANVAEEERDALQEGLNRLWFLDPYQELLANPEELRAQSLQAARPNNGKLSRIRRYLTGNDGNTIQQKGTFLKIHELDQKLNQQLDSGEMRDVLRKNTRASWERQIGEFQQLRDEAQNRIAFLLQVRNTHQLAEYPTAPDYLLSILTNTLEERHSCLEERTLEETLTRWDATLARLNGFLGEHEGELL